MMSGRPYRTFRWMLVAVLIMPLSGVAEESVEVWMERMHDAINSIDYRGTLIHLRDGKVDTLRIIHRVDEDGVRERIYALDGQPREIVRDRNSVRCLLSDSETVVVPNQFPARLLPRLPIERITDREDIYELRFAGTDRVADLDTRIVEIEPKDQYRYGHRLWLDEATGMLLRSAVLDEDGRIIQQLSFVSIEFDARIPDSELEPGFEYPTHVAEFDARTIGQATESQVQEEPSWLPEQLPKGFKLSSVARSTGPAGQKLEHLLFSDGLASFSIYVEDLGDKSVTQSIGNLGPVHVYTGQLEDQLITVVGEVPASTVAIIGRHLRRAATPSLRHFP